MREVREASNVKEPDSKLESAITEKPEDTKLCPICGETIKARAKKCIHCNEFIERYESPGWFGWTGFKGKTAWDFLGLLIVPFVLAVISIWFANFQDKRENKRDDMLRQMSIAATSTYQKEQSNANILQSYLDDMTSLIQEAERLVDDRNIATIIRARTLSVLKVLDGQRNGTALRFLQETELTDLVKEDLEGINLSFADLRAADLTGAYLLGADLSLANLFGADLREATLREANLRGADLSFADLSLANLRGADLSEADLEGANLEGAKYNTEPYEDELEYTHQPTQWPANFDPTEAGAIDVSKTP